ncbi:hypothetical protein, partial [Corallococcus exiguus]|uniref:hypothetical protein n=1 Tax=Corallococcus exiguus TaxID=83462 RepID=UPI001C26AEEF
MKEGGLNADWTLQRSAATAIALAGNRIGALSADGNVYVKEGGLNADWTLQRSAATAIALAGNRIGALSADGNVY